MAERCPADCPQPTSSSVSLSTHSSSAPALLVASLPLAPAAAHQRTAQALLPTALSPAPCCPYICLCPPRLYVRRCNTTPSPWWPLCPQWSVHADHSHGRAAIRVDLPKSLVSCHVMPVHLCAPITRSPSHGDAGAERRGAMRKNNSK